MPDYLPTPRDIERWVPPDLTELVGCPDVKGHFSDQLRLDACGTNTLVIGGTGTGKTASVKAFVRSLMCPTLNHDTLKTCGGCVSCKTFDVRYREEGLFALAQQRVKEGLEPINFCPINCGAVTENELRQLLQDRADFSGRFVIYLDEVHRIIRRKMDHLLLKPLEEMDALWIASTARPDELDPMFLRRFSAHLSTSLPTQMELADFLAARCGEWRITVDDHDTLELLARRARCVPAKTISVLAIAAGRPERRLTRALVLRQFSDIAMA